MIPNILYYTIFLCLIALILTLFFYEKLLKAYKERFFFCEKLLKDFKKKLIEKEDSIETLTRELNIIKGNNIFLKKQEYYTVTEEMKNRFPALKRYGSHIYYLTDVGIMNSNSKSPSIKHLFVDNNDELLLLSSHIIDKVSEDLE